MHKLMLVSVALSHAFLHAQPGLDTGVNAALNGKYYFRWIAYSGIDGSAEIQQAIAAHGTIFFDGAGNYRIDGQIVSSTNSPGFPRVFTPAGTYVISSSGMAEIQNPIFPGDTLYAGVGASAIVGSSTERGNHDLFVAIPAPATPVTNAALTGVYRTALFDFAGGVSRGATDALFSLVPDGKGGFAPFQITGSSASRVVPAGQTVAGASYSLRSDASGTAIFPAGSLVAGGKVIYLSSDGETFLAGSPAGFDILVGIHALNGSDANQAYNGLYYTASLQHDLRSVPYHQSLHGARNVQAGQIWYQERINAAPNIPANHYDGTDNVALAPFDTSGTYTNPNFCRIVGAGGRIFLESGRGGFYELYIGVKARPYDSSGVAISPYGIVNGANLQPATNPIAPGEVVSIFGSGFATTRSDATSLPLPLMLNNVEVKVNGRAAPLLSVSPTQINLVVPFGTSEPYANFQVIVDSKPSNMVTLYTRATAPGVFTIPSGGGGDAAVLHADYSLVSPSRGARPGEIVMVFLTGLGTVSPAITDGAIAPLLPTFNVVPPATNVAVYIAGTPANVSFAGLAPGFAGLYQINVEVPPTVSAAWPTGRGGVSRVPLEIDTADGATITGFQLDLSDIPKAADLGVANTAPLANSQSVSTAVNVAKSITLTATDIETPGGAFSYGTRNAAPHGTGSAGGLDALLANLTFTVTSNPLHGSLSGTPPNLVYTPDPNFMGADSFQFTAADRGNPDNCGAPGPDCAQPLTSLAATISVTVVPVNTPPTANSQTISDAPGTATSITLTGSDAETSAAGLAFTVTSTPAHGTLSGIAPNLIYAPLPGYFGPDAFQFTVTDHGSPDNCGVPGPACADSLTSAPATVTIAVQAINNRPVANSQNINGAVNTPLNVTLGGSDAETPSGALTFAIASGPNNGRLSGTAPNLIYTPNSGFVGKDTIQFTVTDRGSPDNCAAPLPACAPSLTSLSGSINISILAPPNNPPTAAAQSVTVGQNSTRTITMTGSDRESAALTFTVTANPAHGTLSGSGPNVIYTPAANYIGFDSFQFKTTDRGSPDNCGAPGPFCTAALDSTAATVTIAVVAVNTLPVAAPQSVITNEGVAKPIVLSGSDKESPSANLVFTITSSPTHGTLSGVAPNLIYTPTAGYTGSDSFQFKVTDGGNPVGCSPIGTTCAGSLDSTPATVSIAVAPVNTMPSATPQSTNVNQNSAKAITLAGADLETAPANLSFAVTANPAHGTLSGTTPNLTYTPNANYIGVDAFQFTVTDRGKPDNCGTPGASCAGVLTSTAAMVSINVLPVNTAPTANPLSVSTNEGAATTIALTGTDLETPGANLGFRVSVNPIHGTLSGIAPNLTYTPSAGYFGPDSFQFTVTDRGNPDACSPAGNLCAAALTSSSAAVVLTIIPVNTAPAAAAQSVNANQNAPKPITLTGTDAETTSANLTYSVTSNPAHGSLSGTAPNLVYTPSANYVGPDTFQFTVTDRGKPDNCGAPGSGCSGALSSSAATVNINVIAVNTAPVATAQNISTNEATPIAVTLAGTDAETAPANLRSTIIATPAHGTLSGTLPNLTYTPNAGYFGSDSLQFTVTDRGNPDNCGAPANNCAAPLTSAAATINIAVVPVNTAPSATPQSINVNENSSKSLTLTGADAETSSANLNFSVTSGPLHGTLSGTAPNLTYTPNSNYFGADSFQFKATDRGKPDNCGAPGANCSGVMTSTAATVNITVAPVNSAPIGTAQSLATNENTGLGITLSGSDAETAPANLTFNVTATPVHGVLSGTLPNLVYTPLSGFFGVDSFQFTVTDRGNPDNCGVPGSSCVSPLTSTAAGITITVVPVNTAPKATAQSVSVNENASGPIALAGTDAETAVANLSFQVTVNPSHGSLSGTAPNLTYTPAANYFGPDSFQFTVTDRGKPDNCGSPNLGCSASLTSSAGTVSITVVPVNSPPTASPQLLSTNEGTALPIGLVGSDLETAIANLGFTISTPPAHGSLSGTPPNITYTPFAGYFGADSFQFTVTDRGNPDNCGSPNPPNCLASVTSSAATVSITISPVNTAPIATPQSVGTNQDTSKVITLAGNDAETAAASLIFNVTSVPLHGSLTGSAPNFIYTPAPGYFGPDSFQFTVTDRGKPNNCGVHTVNCSVALTSAPATVSITVTPVNTAPMANSQSVSTPAATPASITLTGSDNETPSGNLSFTVTALPAHGSLAGTPPNLTYTSAAGYAGTDAFQFIVTDRGKPDNCGAPGPNCAALLSSTAATVSISVVKPPAITSGNSASFQPGKTGQTFTVQTTGFPSGASMSISSGIGLPGGVALTNNNDGTATISGTPAAGTAGNTGNPRSQAYAFTITANNGVTPNATQIFSLNVTCPVITVNGPAAFSLIYGVDSVSTIPNNAARTYSQSGGNGAIAFSITGQPAGISINSSTGVISGIPASTGDFNAALITATDAGGCTATKIVDISVAPVATNDTYTNLVDNTQAVVTGGATSAPGTPFVALTGSLLANDRPAGNVIATPGTFITTGGGSVTISADGTFIYTPKVNPSFPANTTDSFTYTISSNTGGTPTAMTAAGTVNLGFTGRVWYVRNPGSDFSNTGQSQSPFLSVAKAASVSFANDIIFLYSGNDANLGGIALKQGQSLIGEGAGLIVGGRTLVNPGSFPTLGGTVAGIGVTGLTVKGLSMSTGSVTAVFLLNSDGNFTFRSVLSSAGSNAIIWDNSGGSSATGSLTITGDGSDTSLGGNASGGTMGNTSGQDGSTAGSAIWLNNVSNITLRRILINGTNQNFGIRGVNVNNFVLEYSTVGGTNGNSIAFDEGSIIFDSLFGTATFTKIAVSGSVKDNLHVRNLSGSLNATIDGSTFTNAPNNNLMFEPSGTALITARVTNNNFSGAGAHHLLTTTTNSATLNIVFTGNFFSMGSFAGSLWGGVTITGGGPGSSERVNFNISNNGSAAVPLTGTVQGGAINVNQANGNGVWQGQVSNNFIGNPGVPNSGCVFCSGIRVENHSNGAMTTIISGNVVRQWNSGAAINTLSGEVGNADTFNATIANNTASNPGPNAQHGLLANMGPGMSLFDASQVCLDISANLLGGNGANGGSGIRVQQQEVSTVRLRGYGGTPFDAASVVASLTAQNPGSSPAPTATTSGAGGGFLNTSPAGFPCAQPIVPQ